MIKNNVVYLLSELGSSIASDNLNCTDTIIKKLKRSNTDSKKIYEAILQSYLFCGFPAAIETLKIFKKYFPDFNKSNTPYNISKFRKNGIFNCKLIYKKNYKKLIENMTGLSPDLKEWMIIEGYGKVLGRDGLNLLEREFINVAILCTRFYKNQLHSHLLGCIYLGANSKELLNLVKRIEKTAGKKNVLKSIQLIKSLKISMINLK